MSVLARYRKRGGFKQLLQLIETSQPAKQAKLLAAVKNEDPSWAELLEKKKLTTDMVLSWESETLVLVFERMMIRHCATLLKFIDEQKLTDLKSMFKMNKWIEIKEIWENLDKIPDSEKITAENHMLETVRQLDEDKVIILRFINPKLELDDVA